MTQDLHDRLADLAESAPSATSYAELWERGRSYGRRRTAARLGTLCCLVLLCAAATLTWPVVAPRDVSPATGGQAHLPDRFFAPSPWLDGTDDAGPIGPLIALLQSPRKSWSITSPLSATPTNGVVGVSATTGDYRFLDLPDRTTQGEASTELALSPDGRHVAYWITGATAAQPNTRRASDTVAGYAVYDTVNGDVIAREVFPTEHGLATGSMAWVDADTLEVAFSQYQTGWEAEDPGFATGSTAWLRDLDDSASRTAPPVWAELDGSTDLGLVMLRSGADSFVLMDPEQPGSRRKITMSEPTRDGWLLRPDGRVVVGVSSGPDPDNVTSLPKPLVVGPLGAGDQVRLHEVPDFRFNGQIEGWRDDTHVLVRRDATGTPGDQPWLMSVDIRTGAAEKLAALAGVQPALAVGLMDAPVVEATAPPTPMDPRLRLGLSLAAALTGLAGLVALNRWRRRARP
jgi:hypothetical protein